MPISNLPLQTEALTGSDQIAINPANALNSTYRVPLSALGTLIRNQFVNPTFTTITGAVGPSTAFDLSAQVGNVWLIGIPSASEAGFNIALPSAPIDGQTIMVTCSIAFAAQFTGTGAPSGFLGAVDGSVVIRYSSTLSGWRPISAGGKGLVAPRIADHIADENGNEVIGLGSVPDAVNYVEVTNAATGNAVSLRASGGDTDIDLEIEAAGNGDVAVRAPGSGTVNLTSDSGPVNITGTDGIARTFLAVALRPRTIAQLDTLATSLGSPQGLRAMASDGNGVVFQAVQNGGGATLVPVYFDGLDWRNG